MAGTVQPEAELAKAQKLYENREYQQAEQMYDTIMSRYGTSASLLFNLANCYACEGNLAKARLYYERAKRLDPADKEIANNLSFVASKIYDSNIASAGKDKELLAEDNPSFIDSIGNIIAEKVASNTWAVLAAVCFVLLILSMALYIFFRSVMIRKIGFFGALGFLILNILFVVFSFIAAHRIATDDDVIVTAFKTVLLKNPESSSKTASPVLSGGTKLSVEKSKDGADGKPEWYFAVLNEHCSGWLRAEDVEPINK